MRAWGSSALPPPRDRATSKPSLLGTKLCLHSTHGPFSSQHTKRKYRASLHAGDLLGPGVPAAANSHENLEQQGTDGGTEGQRGEAPAGGGRTGAGTSFACSQFWAAGCWRGPVEAWCPPQSCALFPSALLWPTGAPSPGWHHRRSPSGAAAGPAAPAQGLPEAFGRGPPAGPCGRRPGGPGGTGHRPPGGAKPHPPCPAPSGAWPAGTRHGRPCGESSWERADPCATPLSPAQGGRLQANAIPASGPGSTPPAGPQRPGSCWKGPRAIPRVHGCPFRHTALGPHHPPHHSPPPHRVGILQMRNRGCVLTPSQPCLSFLFCKNRIKMALHGSGVP